MTHSKLPWRLEHREHYNGNWYIWDADSRRAADCEELFDGYPHGANARLIVTAVNSHHALLKALAFAQSVIKSREPWTATCEEIIGGAFALAKGETQ